MEEVIFVDANIFLEIFLQDSKAEKCKTFLRSAQEQKRQMVTTDFIVYSCLILVQKQVKNTKLLRNTILFFHSLPNLLIVRPSPDEWYDAIEIMERYTLDFDDSLVIASMQRNNIKKLLSMDKHFDKIKDIQKINI